MIIELSSWLLDFQISILDSYQFKQHNMPIAAILFPPVCLLHPFVHLGISRHVLGPCHIHIWSVRAMWHATRHLAHATWYVMRPLVLITWEVMVQNIDKVKKKKTGQRRDWGRKLQQTSRTNRNNNYVHM